MFEDPLAERYGAQDHRKSKPYLMHHVRAEQPTRRRHGRDDHGRGEAMHEAQARKTDGEPVPKVVGSRWSEGVGHSLLGRSCDNATSAPIQHLAYNFFPSPT